MGVLLLECAYLYTADAEYTYEDMEREMKAKLMALADQACSYMHNERSTTHPMNLGAWLMFPWLRHPGT